MVKCGLCNALISMHVIYRCQILYYLIIILNYLIIPTARLSACRHVYSSDTSIFALLLVFGLPWKSSLSTNLFLFNLHLLLYFVCVLTVKRSYEPCGKSSTETTQTSSGHSRTFWVAQPVKSRGREESSTLWRPPWRGGYTFSNFCITILLYSMNISMHGMTSNI